MSLAIVRQVGQLLAYGARARTVASTRMNTHSSRSHAIFTLTLTRRIAAGEAAGATSPVSDCGSGGGGIANGGSNGGAASSRERGPTTRASKICMVDLAGSERVAQTGTKGDRLREAKNINKSLATLCDVIRALAEISAREQQQQQSSSSMQQQPPFASSSMSPGSGAMSSLNASPLSSAGGLSAGGGATPSPLGGGGGGGGSFFANGGCGGSNSSNGGGGGGGSTLLAGVHVPYRNSLLTWLLKDSLGGNAKTTVLAAISPCDTHYDETISTLKVKHLGLRRGFLGRRSVGI